MSAKQKINQSFLRMLYFILATAAFCCGSQHGWAGKLVMSAVDQKGEQVPFRIHLFDSANEAVKHPSLPFHYDHFVCPGQLELDLPAGDYSFEVERGPEHKKLSGMVSIAKEGTKKVELEIPQLINMNQRGWYSGDLHIHRPVEDVPLLIEAEGLNIAPVITWWNQTNRWSDGLPEKRLFEFNKRGVKHFYDVLAGEDERAGGALLYFGLKKPLPIQNAGREFPSSKHFLRMVPKKQWVETSGGRIKEPQSFHVDIEKPFWWDVPMWVGGDRVDTIGIANNHMCRTKMYESEAWGVPRDEKRLPAPKGNGYWTQEIYYHLLNSSHAIPPSAGSASGVLPNPVGYNRVYVHVDGELTWQKWWDGLRAGQSFVTNGPMLLVKANGQLPGFLRFTNEERRKDERQIKLEITLFLQDEIETVELIHNGQVVKQIEVIPDGKTKTEVNWTCKESGWFLVRAIAKNNRTFRFASTAPYQVRIDGKPNSHSQGSIQFFIDWLEKRIEQVKENVEDETQKQRVLKDFESARKYWEFVKNLYQQ